MSVGVREAGGVPARPPRLSREERARRRREMLFKALREALASQNGESSVVDEELGEGVSVEAYADGAHVHYRVYGGRGDGGLDVFEGFEARLEVEPGGRFHVTWINVEISQGSRWADYSVEGRKAVAERIAEAFNDAAAALNIPLRVSGVERSGDVIHAVLETPLGRYRGGSFSVELRSGVPRVVNNYPVVKVNERLARRLSFLKRYAELARQEEERWLKTLAEKLSAALGGRVRCEKDYETYLAEGQFVELAAFKAECSTADEEEAKTFLLPRVWLERSMDLSNLAWGAVILKASQWLTEEELVRVLEEESRRVLERLVRAVALMKKHPDPIQREHGHFLWALIERAYYDVTGESLLG
jgi:hypothetical protein